MIKLVKTSASHKENKMEVKLNIDATTQFETVVFNIRALTPKINGLIEELTKADNHIILNRDDEILFVDPSEIVAFSTRDNKIGVVLKDNSECFIKKKLADLEEEFAVHNMIRVSKSAIINTKEIKKFIMQYNSTILIEFKNGYQEYVSRRYVKKIKQHFNI